VRPGTQVEEASHGVYRHGVARDVVDELQLVALSQLAEILARARLIPHFARDGKIALEELVHARLDPPEVFRSEGLHHFEVVVEAVVDGGAYGELGVRE
jgi:hypothetical protein